MHCTLCIAFYILYYIYCFFCIVFYALYLTKRNTNDLKLVVDIWQKGTRTTSTTTTLQLLSCIELLSQQKNKIVAYLIPMTALWLSLSSFFKISVPHWFLSALSLSVIRAHLFISYHTRYASHYHLSNVIAIGCIFVTYFPPEVVDLGSWNFACYIWADKRGGISKVVLGFWNFAWAPNSQKY